ncbi:MAG: MarR family winged helix-turn-helix transcriptional regulator [Eubacteriales bacterium]
MKGEWDSMIDLKESFHDVNIKRKMYFDMFIEESELNLMEIEILVFLYQFPENNTFTEVMKSKGYAKSYISKAINHLVEIEYMSKQPSDTNKKVYNLFLLDKSESIVMEYNRCLQRFRTDAFAGIMEEEFQVFERVIGKISENLDKI